MIGLTIPTLLLMGIPKSHINYGETKSKFVNAVIIGQASTLLPIGTPGIIDIESYNSHSNSMKFITVFPGNESYVVNSNEVAIDKTVDFNLENHSTGMLLSSRDNKKIHSTINGLEKHGATTLVTNKRCFIDVMKRINTMFKERYKYLHVFNCGYDNLESLLGLNGLTDEPVIPTLTFINIKHCIQIFNKKKVDGFGLKMETVYPYMSMKRGRLVKGIKISAVFSKYQDNLFYIDGEQIRNHVPDIVLPELKKSELINSVSRQLKNHNVYSCYHRSDRQNNKLFDKLTTKGTLTVNSDNCKYVSAIIPDNATLSDLSQQFAIYEADGSLQINNEPSNSLQTDDEPDAYVGESEAQTGESEAQTESEPEEAQPVESSALASALDYV